MSISGTAVDKGSKSHSESLTLDQSQESQLSQIGGSGQFQGRSVGTGGQLAEAGSQVVKAGGGLFSKTTVNTSDMGAIDKGIGLASEALAFGFSHLMASTEAAAENARQLSATIGSTLQQQSEAATEAIDRQTQTTASDLRNQLIVVGLFLIGSIAAVAYLKGKGKK